MCAMSVTRETSQPERSPSKEDAHSNMLAMLVADDTFHPDMSPSKEDAPRNILDTSVTPETSQPERSPSKEDAPVNIRCMLSTPDRSGASAALYVMFDAPLNACSIDSHRTSPHCSIDCSFCALAWPPSAKRILVKLPVMLTVYVPASSYS